ncbi:MAG: NapC/NirT family cytochrome c, partial [Sedimenticola sp.]
MANRLSGVGLTRKKSLLILLAVFFAGVVFAGLFNVGLSATNEMGFCVSCHSMKV